MIVLLDEQYKNYNIMIVLLLLLLYNKLMVFCGTVGLFVTSYDIAAHRGRVKRVIDWRRVLVRHVMRRHVRYSG